ncbi:MAG: hypothetical protein ABIJ09_00860 [Pseudomonadota bacterium]
MRDDTTQAIGEVYTMLLGDHLPKKVASYQLGKAVLENAEDDIQRLALLEANVHFLDVFLSDVAEHGHENLALWGVEKGALPAMVTELQINLKHVEKMKSIGKNSRSITGAYVRDMVIPIGSREWLQTVKLGVKNMDDTWKSMVLG